MFVSELILSLTNAIPVQSELSYVIGMLEYVVERISSKESMIFARRRRSGGEEERGFISTGCFLNLKCGHNNQYSPDERDRLMHLICRASGDSV
jgi:hypothetical protein